eukprot:m51a1_g14553 hypothetical protein (604) ;mRNA; f:1007497-1013258
MAQQAALVPYTERQRGVRVCVVKSYLLQHNINMAETAVTQRLVDDVEGIFSPEDLVVIRGNNFEADIDRVVKEVLDNQRKIAWRVDDEGPAQQRVEPNPNPAAPFGEARRQRQARNSSCQATVAAAVAAGVAVTAGVADVADAAGAAGVADAADTAGTAGVAAVASRHLRWPLRRLLQWLQATPRRQHARQNGSGGWITRPQSARSRLASTRSDARQHRGEQHHKATLEDLPLHELEYTQVCRMRHPPNTRKAYRGKQVHFVLWLVHHHPELVVPDFLDSLLCGRPLGSSSSTVTNPDIARELPEAVNIETMQPPIVFSQVMPKVICTYIKELYQNTDGKTKDPPPSYSTTSGHHSAIVDMFDDYGIARSMVFDRSLSAFYHALRRKNTIVAGSQAAKKTSKRPLGYALFCELCSLRLWLAMTDEHLLAHMVIAYWTAKTDQEGSCADMYWHVHTATSKDSMRTTGLRDVDILGTRLDRIENKLDMLAQAPSQQQHHQQQQGSDDGHEDDADIGGDAGGMAGNEGRGQDDDTDCDHDRDDHCRDVSMAIIDQKHELPDFDVCKMWRLWCCGGGTWSHPLCSVVLGDLQMAVARKNVPITAVNR